MLTGAAHWNVCARPELQQCSDQLSATECNTIYFIGLFAEIPGSHDVQANSCSHTRQSSQIKSMKIIKNIWSHKAAARVRVTRSDGMKLVSVWTRDDSSKGCSKTTAASSKMLTKREEAALCKPTLNSQKKWKIKCSCRSKMTLCFLEELWTVTSPTQPVQHTSHVPLCLTIMDENNVPHF